MEQDSRSQACVNQPFFMLKICPCLSLGFGLCTQLSCLLSTTSEVWEVQVSVIGIFIAGQRDVKAVISVSQVPQVV